MAAARPVEPFLQVPQGVSRVAFVHRRIAPRKTCGNTPLRPGCPGAETARTISGGQRCVKARKRLGSGAISPVARDLRARGARSAAWRAERGIERAVASRFVPHNPGLIGPAAIPTARGAGEAMRQPSRDRLAGTWRQCLSPIAAGRSLMARRLARIRQEAVSSAFS